MLKKDYLLAQIEELAKKYAALIEKKEAGESNLSLSVDDCYGVLGISLDWLRNAECEDIISRIGVWGLIELLVKTMLDDYRVNDRREWILKAQSLLFYVQELDKTYSVERIELEYRIERMLER